MSKTIDLKLINDSRVQWIDIAKAIAIIGVAVTHVPWKNPNIDQMISIFCLPMFFVIAGYLFDYTKYQNDFKTFVKNSTKRLVFPGYITYAILHPVSSINPIKAAIYAVGKPVSLLGIDRIAWGLWFFYCLFIVKMLLYGFVKFANKYKTSTFLNIVFLCVISYMGTKIGRIIPLPWSTDIALVTLYLAYIGYIIKEFKILENKKLILPITIICLIIGYFDYHYGLLKMNNRGYGNFPLLTIHGGIALSILMMYISKYITTLKSFTTYAKFLQYIGANSMVIMFAHLLITAFDNIHLLGCICDILGALVLIEILNIIPFFRDCYQIKSITTFFPAINSLKENCIELTKNIFTRFKTSS